MDFEGFSSNFSTLLHSEPVGKRGKPQRFFVSFAKPLQRGLGDDEKDRESSSRANPGLEKAESLSLNLRLIPSFMNTFNNKALGTQKEQNLPNSKENHEWSCLELILFPRLCFIWGCSCRVSVWKRTPSSLGAPQMWARRD